MISLLARPIGYLLLTLSGSIFYKGFYGNDLGVVVGGIALGVIGITIIERSIEKDIKSIRDSVYDSAAHMLADIAVAMSDLHGKEDDKK